MAKNTKGEDHFPNTHNRSSKLSWTLWILTVWLIDSLKPRLFWIKSSWIATRVVDGYRSLPVYNGVRIRRNVVRFPTTALVAIQELLTQNKHGSNESNQLDN